MICTNCYEAEMETQPYSFVDRGMTISTDCEMCPKCGDILFTHEQSLEIDRQRLLALMGRGAAVAQRGQ